MDLELARLYVELVVRSTGGDEAVAGEVADGLVEALAAAEENNGSELEDQAEFFRTALPHLLKLSTPR